MRKIYLFLLMGSLLTCFGSCQNNAYHISKEGNDSNPGTKRSPFLTLAKASEVLEPGDLCVVHAGIYRECFTPKNSGTSERPIVLLAAEGEKVVISGMEAMKDWQPAGEGIFKAKTSWDLGESNFVMIDGKMGFEARFPNKTNDDPLDTEGGTIIAEYESKRDAGEVLPNPVRFISETPVPLHWTGEDLSEAKVWVLAHRKWSGWTAPVTGYDPQEQLIWFKEFEGSQIKDNFNPNWIQASYGSGLYYMFGSKVLLDVPNEWYFDKNLLELHVILPGNKEPVEGQVEFRKRELAVDLADKKFWEVSGFKIEGSTVDMSNAENCIIDKCRISYFWHSVPAHSSRAMNTRTSGITVSGKNNTIKNSEISYSALAGITLSGEGNIIANNQIQYLNYLGSISSGALQISGLNHQIIYNTIHTTGRDLMKYQAGGSVIAWNHLYNPGMICYDLGAVYSGGTDYRNTIIHHNLVHNDNWKHHPVNGIYFDNFTNNVVVHHNIIWGNIRTGIRSNRPGNYHQIFNNTTISMDNKWSPWQGPSTQFGSCMVNNYILRPLLANEEVFKANNAAGFPFDTLNFIPLEVEQREGINKYGFPGYIGALTEDAENWTGDAGHDFNRNSIPPVDRDLPFMRNYLENGSFDWGRDRSGDPVDETEVKFWEKSGEVELSYSRGFNFPSPETRNSVYANSLLLKSDEAGISQVVKGLEPDFPYIVGVYVRSYDNADIILSVQSTGLQAEASSIEIAPMAGWKFIVLAFRTGPQESEVEIQVRKTGKGDVYLDNMGLVPDLLKAEIE